MIPPFDHPDVIAGQGTVGLEILEQWPEVRTILVPVGGGGLLGRDLCCRPGNWRTGPRHRASNRPEFPSCRPPLRRVGQPTLAGWSESGRWFADYVGGER